MIHEPPWYGTVCPVVWEDGGSNPASYPIVITSYSIHYTKLYDLGSERIKWNFTKFLIDPAGKVIKRYAPFVKPKDIERDIEKLLA